MTSYGYSISLAVTGSPLDHLAFFRNVIVTVLAFRLIVWLAKPPLMILKFLSVWNRPLVLLAWSPPGEKTSASSEFVDRTGSEIPWNGESFGSASFKVLFLVAVLSVAFVFL